jgi:hypothetical protein
MRRDPPVACSASLKESHTMFQAINDLIQFIQEAREAHLDVANQ